MTRPDPPHRGHVGYQELVAGQALHALEPDDEAMLDAHLAGCASCREQLWTARHTAANLATAVEQYAPPARLRSSLLAEVERTPQRGVGNPTTPSKVKERSQASDLDRVRSRGKLGRTVFAAAAAMLLAAVITLGIRVGQLGAERDLRVANATAIQQMLARSAQPGAELAVFHPEGQPTGTATPVAMLLRADGKTTLLPTDMRRTSNENTYVIWALDAAHPVALGTFDVDPANPRPHTINPLGGTKNSTGFGISLEPGKAAPQEPSNVVALASITRAF